MMPCGRFVGCICMLSFTCSVELIAESSLALDSTLPEVSRSAGPDGTYLTRSHGPWGSNARSSILFQPVGDATLRAPAFARPDADEGDFYYSPELEQACFVSDRASPGDPDIWCMAWAGEHWTEPERLPGPVKSAAREYSPVIVGGGTLYFASDRAAGEGTGLEGTGQETNTQGDIYRGVSTPGAGAWRVEALPETINSDSGEWNLELTPDQQGMIFEASGRATNRTVPGDLYFSRREAGEWTAAVPLSRLNGGGSDLMPRYQPDGELLYAKSKGPDANIVKAQAGTWEPIRPVVVAVSRSAAELVLMDPDTLAEVGRVPAGTGPHDVASSEDGRYAIAPSFGVFPVPHVEAVEAADVRWVNRASEGLLLLDLKTGVGRAVVELLSCTRPHGVAATAQAQRFWVTCEDDGSVREFSGDDYRERRRFDLGKGVHKVMLLPQRGVLVASNPEAGGVDLVDLVDGAIIHVATGKGAEGLAASADESRVFVSNGFQDTVCVVDVASARRIGCWSSGGKFPIALAHDARRDWLWVINNATASLVAMDARTGEILRTIALPSPPLGLALDVRADRVLIGLPRRNEVIAVSADSGEILLRSPMVMEVDDIDLVPAAYFGQAADT